MSIMKWLKVPASNATKEIAAVQMWEVRWYGRDGIYHDDIRWELEAFNNEADAQAFAESLRNSFSLLRISGEKTGVQVKKAK